MALDPHIHQRMLELIYDLLPEAEAAELRRQIASDPALTAAYEKAEATVGLLGEAARQPAPRITLKRPEKHAMSQSAEPSTPAKPRTAAASPWARPSQWIVGLSATVLLVVSLGGYFYDRKQREMIAAEHLRLMVTGPASLQSDAGAEYVVTTTTVTGEPLRCRVRMALCTPDGRRLVEYNDEQTESDKPLRLTIPAGIALGPQAELRVTAVHGGKPEEFRTMLPVEPARYVTHLSLDKPLYQPGETVCYRSLSLSRFGLAVERPMGVHFEILDPGGSTVPGTAHEGVTNRGVGNGAFTLPRELNGGQYTLVARSLDGAFPEEKLPFHVQRYRLPRLKMEMELARDSYTPGDTVTGDFRAQRAEGGEAANLQLDIRATVDGQIVLQKTAQTDAAGRIRIECTLPKPIARGDAQLVVAADDGGTRETLAKTIPINLGKVDVRFFPEGGDLVEGIENRIYFSARSPLGKPVHIKGMLVDARGSELAEVETFREGLGSFLFTPISGESYRVKLDKPVGVTSQPKLPAATAGRNVVLSTGGGVFNAGGPLEFSLRATKANIPLVVAARCRGVQVGQCSLVTRTENSGLNPISIPLDDNVGGVIRLTVYEYGDHPPQPVAERLVYRRSARRLTVHPAEHQERYAPGDKVRMALIVKNEKGEPVPAALGVSVVDGTLLILADDHSASMTTHMMLTSEIERPEDLEKADFFLSDDKDAPRALDLLLGTQGWRRLIETSVQDQRKQGYDAEHIARLLALNGPEQPPAVFDNLNALRDKYEHSLTEYQQKRTKSLTTLTIFGFFGGLALLLMVALLVTLKVVSGLRLWAPAALAAACCLVVGVVLLDPNRLRPNEDATVAFAPTSVAKAESEKATAKDVPMEREMESRRRRTDIRMEVDADRRWRTDPIAQEMAEQINAAFAAEQRRLKLDAGTAIDETLGHRHRVVDFQNPIDFPGGDRDVEVGEGNAQIHNMEAMLQRILNRGSDPGKNEEALAPYRFTVREYAHKHVKGPKGVRSDFAQTLYWNPLLIAGADGRAEVGFELSDSVTAYRVRVDVHADGRIGSGGGEVIAKIPFSLEPKLPLEVTAGDRIDLPVAVINGSAAAMPVELSLDSLKLLKLDGPARRTIELAAGQRAREYFTLSVSASRKGDSPIFVDTKIGTVPVSGRSGVEPLCFRGSAGSLSDAVKQDLRIVPPGFPQRQSFGGQVDGPQQVTLVLPKSWVPGSLEVTLRAFPSPLADLQKGMEGMLQEPNGCFEQASSSNYPNVLSLQYMREHDAADPAITRRAKELLKTGYARLTAYECKQQGYEWFGGDPGHEALTAYGLMEFRDMAGVFEVDAEMLRRTAEWLLSRRDGKGGFQRNARALDSFGAAPADITDAYIVWALSEAGQKDIDREIQRVDRLASASDDPYLIALAAAADLNAGRQEPGRKLLERLSKRQAADGRLEGKQGSITRSGGVSLTVETTALATLAWLKHPAFTAPAQKAIDWLVKNRQPGGGFGSTQATVLALKALVVHSKSSRKIVADGSLLVVRDDEEIGRRDFTAGQTDAIALAGLEAKLQPGENRLVLKLTGNNAMPYALDVGYRTLEPASDKRCRLRLSTGLDASTVKAGQTVALTAELSNTADAGQPMALAVLGLPAGLEARTSQLDDLKKAGTIDYYETRAREVILYWRSLAPKKKVEVKLDLIATVPGKYEGPASRAYLYYTAEQKQWCPPLKVKISRE